MGKNGWKIWTTSALPVMFSITATATLIGGSNDYDHRDGYQGLYGPGYA